MAGEKQSRPRTYVDGCLNPRLSGAGSKNLLQIWRRRRGSVAFCRSHSFPEHRTDGGIDGWAADHCQGRQPPKAGAEGPPLQWSAAQPQSAPRIDWVAARHFQVEFESFWVDGHVTTRQRMHIRLRVEPFLPVVSLYPLSPTGRYLSAMRSWPGILWSGLCAGGQAPQPAGSAPPIPGDRARAPDAYRS